jgi:hypothetical protein
MAAAVLMEEELQHSMDYLRLPFFEHAAKAWTFKAPSLSKHTSGCCTKLTCRAGMATSEEDAEFEEDDELAADPLGDNDEFAANNQLHNELGQSEEDEEGEEGVSDEDAEGEDEEMAEIHGDEESEEESDEDEDGEGVGGMLESYPCPEPITWSIGTMCLSRY